MSTPRRRTTIRKGSPVECSNETMTTSPQDKVTVLIFVVTMTIFIVGVGIVKSRTITLHRLATEKCTAHPLSTSSTCV